MRSFILILFYITGITMSYGHLHGQSISNGARECLEKSGMVTYNTNIVHVVSSDTLRSMYNCADRYSLSYIELINYATIILQENNVRLKISGDIIRELNAHYKIGGTRTRALFPIRHIVEMEFGASITAPASPSLEISLDTVPNPYAEKVNFIGYISIYLNLYYGFYTAEVDRFLDAFGISAAQTDKKKIKKRTLSRIHIYEQNKIAIYISKFLRPKRWRIDQVARKK